MICNAKYEFCNDINELLEFIAKTFVFAMFYFCFDGWSAFNSSKERAARSAARLHSSCFWMLCHGVISQYIVCGGGCG